MRKLFLIVALGVAGVMSSNTTTAKKENIKKDNIKKETVIKKESKNNLKAVATLERECRAVRVTCTSAYTCQDWTEEQWYNWAYQIQLNYCMIDSPYTP